MLMVSFPLFIQPTSLALSFKMATAQLASFKIPEIKNEPMVSDDLFPLHQPEADTMTEL